MTPQIVADFARLHMQTDEGLPVTPAAHHWVWLELLCNVDIKRLLVVAPPESAKTTWIVAYIACSIGFKPEMPRIFAGAAGDVAERRSLAIRTLIESPAFRETFPHVQRAAGLSYTVQKWSVAPEGEPRAGRIHPTLASYGTGGPITGSRAYEAIGDDILDNENTRTEHMRKFVTNWAHNSFFSRVLARGGRVLMIGTSWHQNDLYADLRGMAGWVVCHMPLLSAGSEVYASISYPDNYKGRRLGEPVGDMDLQKLLEETNG